MGEIIKSYGDFKIKGMRFNVELNGPVSEVTGGIVHIQNDVVRYEMSQLDFYKMVTGLNLARENLIRLKGKDINE